MVFDYINIPANVDFIQVHYNPSVPLNVLLIDLFSMCKSASFKQFTLRKGADEVAS